MKEKRVYLIGGAKGSYRTQNLVKFLLDHNYQVFYNDFNPSLFRGCSGIKRVFRLVVKLLDELVQIPTKIYNLFLADYVVLTAMSQMKQFELITAKLLGKYIITDFYISLYDTLVHDRNQFGKNSWYAKKFLKKDQNSIKLANLLLFLNKTEAKYYLDILNLEEKNYKIVPLCVENKKKCKLRYYRNENNDNVFNICWWGNYIPLHGLDKIIEAASILNEQYELKFHLYLFGTDEIQSKPYNKKIKELKLVNLATIYNDKTFNNGKLEPFLVNNCSLVLGNFGNSDKARNVLVNKLIDGVAMKAPVLTGESKAPKEFFPRDSIYYSNNTAESIALNIFKISQIKRDQIMKIVEYNYEIYNQYFSIEAFEENIKNIFKN
ncbi:glycosyltransferase family protein [Rhodohalobacter halophilus]|uniref:glycosyltransferase n=1 Tax=Rhodohalobacter halophilus TaxID=1812810 RepID=UPI00083F7E38|nr:glycosyltransferase [Rhodohalobacter halophilus]